MFIQRFVPEASKDCEPRPVSLSALGLHELDAVPPLSRLLGAPSSGSPALRACRPAAAGLRPHGGAAAPPLPGAAEPARWVFLSPSRALSSRPHIRVWSAAAAVSVGAGASGAGPGRSKWRRREAERRPRSAQSPRNFRLEAPQLSGKCCRSGGVNGRGSRGGKSRGSGGEPGRLEPAAGAVAESARASRRRGPRLLPRARRAGAGAARRAEPGTARGASPAAAREPGPAPSSRPPGPVAPAPRARARPGPGLPAASRGEKKAGPRTAPTAPWGRAPGVACGSRRP